MSGPVTTYADLGLTWESRLALRLPGPPVLGAVFIAAAFMGAYLCFQWLFDFHVHRISVLLNLMIAYIVMVPRLFAYRVALERQQFGQDVPDTGRKDMEAWVLSYPVDRIRRSRIAGAVGALMFFGLNLWIAYLEGAVFPAFLTQLHTTTVTMGLVMFVGWLMGRTTYLGFSCHSDPPLPDPAEVDLLNLERLYAIGRSGLREALLWIVGMSIGSLFLLDSPISLWGLILLFVVTGLVLGLAVLLKPARRVRRVIQAAKREELARLEPQIKQARDEAMKVDASTQGRLTDLLAYQDRVRATPEWPFDSSTLWRFGLYLLIPVGSMIGGALVERVVNLMLD